GHIVVVRYPKSLAPPCDQTLGLSAEQAEELCADRFATECMLKVGEQFGIRYAYAGALLAVRVCAWLERLGYSFGPLYPPAEMRLAQVRDVCRRGVADSTVFDEISTIGQTFDDMMEMIENRLLGNKMVNTQSPEAVLVRLLAVIE